MSFWKTMPVVVHKSLQDNTFQPIVSKEFLLNKIAKELANAHLKFEYKIYNGNEIHDDFYLEIKKFFDKESSFKEDTHMIYHADIYRFFLADSLILALYHHETKEVIGYMVGKKSKICVNAKILDMLEVSLFSIAFKFRNQHYTPYFIDILLREYIIRYGIYMGTYAISSDINSPHYARKQILHRPLDIQKLIRCEFLHGDDDYTVFTKFERNHSLDIVYLNDNANVSDDIINTLTYKLKQYQSQNYIVYNDLSTHDLRRMFKNKAFHNFILINKDKTIRDFISLYEVGIFVDNVNMSYKSSSIYAMFFANNSVDNIRVALEMVAEYCKKHHIIDVLSYFDIFHVQDYIRDLKCIYGHGTVNYHIFNYNMLSIPNHTNGYVAI